MIGRSRKFKYAATCARSDCHPGGGGGGLEAVLEARYDTPLSKVASVLASKMYNVLRYVDGAFTRYRFLHVPAAVLRRGSATFGASCVALAVALYALCVDDSTALRDVCALPRTIIYSSQNLS